MKSLLKSLKESLVGNIGIGKRQYVIDWAVKHVQGFKKSMGEQTYSANQVYIDNDCKICKNGWMATIAIDTVDVPEQIKFSDCWNFIIFTPKGEAMHRLEDADFIPLCGDLTLQNIYIVGTINMIGDGHNSQINLYNGCLCKNAVFNFPKNSPHKYLQVENRLELPHIKSNCDIIEINDRFILDVLKQKNVEFDDFIRKYVNKSNFPEVKDIILKVGSQNTHYTLKNNHWTEV